MIGDPISVALLKKSPLIDSLIQIGKPATVKLIAVLDDTGKGITAHYILSSIWYNERKIKIDSDSLQIGNSQDEGKGMSILIDGLKYYYKGKIGFYAEKHELERNKKEWQKFIQAMNTDLSIHH